MKSIISITIVIIYCLLCSCSPLKNHYLKKYCKQDSVIFETVIHDTIEVPGEKADTVFTVSNCDSTTTDSVTVDNGKVSATYVRKGNKVKLSANYKGDSIPYQKPIRIVLPCNCPPCPELPKPTFWEKVMLQVRNAFGLIGIVYLLVLGFRFLIAKLL